jgi:hypothetical protein
MSDAAPNSAALDRVNSSSDMRRAAVVATACVLVVTSLTAQDRPLPDPAPFLAEVRKHLQTDTSRQSGYSYVETRRELKLDKHGRTTGESVDVFETYPGLPGEDRWERLISRNGAPVPAEELARQDRERQKQAEEYARRLAREPEQERARQERDVDKDRRETAAVVGDVFVVYDIRMQGRERIDGHDTIAFALTPRPNAQPRTREGRMMRRFTARAWVSESDYEVVRLHVEAIDTVSFGLGLLARLQKGARLSFERRKVNGEVWLPAVMSYSGSARVGLVKTLRRGGVSEFSNYRKFTVDTSSTFAPPASAQP